MLAAIAAGFVGGAAAGFGARLIMFAVRLSNGAYDGATTHAGYENGVWTVEGTMSVVTQGMFFGFPGATLYLFLRSALGHRRVLRGLGFGGLVLVAFGTSVLDGSYEYSRFVSPAFTVPAFAALFPLYGLAVAFLADVIAPPGAVRRPRLRLAAGVVLAGLAVIGAWQLTVELRFRYGF